VFPLPKSHQLQGALPPDPHQGLCPWTPLGAMPPDPQYRLALPRSSCRGLKPTQIILGLPYLVQPLSCSMCKGTNSRKAIYLSEKRICMNFDFPPRQATTWTSLTVEHARRECGHPTACVSISVLTMLAARRQSIARRANNAATWRTEMNINGY